MKFNIILLIWGLIFFSACKKEEPVDQKAIDEQIITNYIADNNLTAIATGSGLYYVMTTPGTGAQPTASSDVTVVYKGYLTDGFVFDQSKTGGLSINLNSVIKGWQEGIPLFKVGGKGKLLIPSALGYGANAQSSIPANSVLIFDINLTAVK